MPYSETTLQSELEDRLQFETLITNLSARFVKLAPEEVDGEIGQALKQVLEFFHGDRCGLLGIRPDQNFIWITHAAYAEGIEHVSGDINLGELFPWARQMLIEKGNVVCFSRIAQIPPHDAPTDIASWNAMGVKSSLSIPLFVENEVRYLASIQMLRAERVWPELYIQRLRLLGEIFVNALERKRAAEALEKQLRFETLMADLSAEFVALSADQVDQAIEDAQRRIVELLDLDRSTLFQRTSHEGELTLTHYWARPEWPAVPKLLDPRQLPWAVGKVLNGEIIRFESINELPPEAAGEAEIIRKFGTKSSVAFPLSAGGHVIGALSFGIAREERKWPDALVERLQRAANVFASALDRAHGEQKLKKALFEVKKLRNQLQRENVYLRQEVKVLHGHEHIAAESPSIRKVLAQATQVAPTASTVLLLGETGAGKERLAAAIHELSPRRERAMVCVNCAAIPAPLIESELFGHEKGSFTGAIARQIGRFEIAQGSTLFLDEVGELPLDLQSKLLRVLQDKRIERLGSAKSVKVDVRIIAATNQDLELAVREGRFRQDLYYRLNVFPLTVPPLRERREDIPILVWGFVDEFSHAMAKPIESVSKASMDEMMRYSWPGNIRELRNVIERAMIVTAGTILRIELPKTSASQPTPSRTSQKARDVEREHILDMLARSGWRIRGEHGAAQMLGLKPTTLESRMSKLGITRPTKL